MAATTRVRNIAKGLAAYDMHVEYIGLRGADVEYSEYKKMTCDVDNIKFSYPGGFTIRSNKWWIRRFDNVMGKWFSALKVINLKKKGKINVVILYTRNLKVVLFWSKLLHYLKIPVVLELCEWPVAIAETKGVGLKSAIKFCKKALDLVDAAIPISSYIDDEIQKISRENGNNIKTKIIPIMIDIEPNAQNNNNRLLGKYLLYSGSISYMDIALLIVDISAELINLGITILIKFTGNGCLQAFEKIKTYAREQGVSEYIEFTGFLPEDELWSLMRGATGLLAPLPNNLQSLSRFPTKLGYYLASGSPVITSATGSVSEYLIDGENAFVARECRANSIAEKIKFVINNPNMAFDVAEKGKCLAFDKFYYRNACKGLNEMLASLCSQKGYE